MTFIKAVLGLQGCGKTMYMTAKAIEWNKKNTPIYSNYHLKNIPYTPIATINDCQKMRNGVALLDEFYHWVFARSSMTKVNKEIVNILTMNRKRNVSVYYSAQLYRTIDVIIRDLTNNFIYPQIKINNGNKYIYYKEYDLLGRRIGNNILRHNTEYYGQFYDTTQEIKDIKENKFQKDIRNGIIKEKECSDLLTSLNIKNELLPDSGKFSGYKGDIITNQYQIDVKGTPKYRNSFRVRTGKDTDYKELIDNAKEKNKIPLIAFENNNIWYIHKLGYNSFIFKLKDKRNITGNTILNYSVELKKFFNYNTK